MLNAYLPKFMAHLPPSLYPALGREAEAPRFFVQGLAIALHYDVQIFKETAHVFLNIEGNYTKDESILQLFSLIHTHLPQTFQLQRSEQVLLLFTTVPTAQADDVLSRLVHISLPLLSQACHFPLVETRNIALHEPCAIPPDMLQEERELLCQLQSASPAELTGSEHMTWQGRHRRWWGLRSLRRLAESKQHLDFSSIFHGGGWANPYADGTVSGDGSSMHNTRVVRAALGGLIKALHISSLLDVPCGDFHWMRYVNLDNVRYLGGDCVNELVASNKSKYAKENIDFTVFDVCGDSLGTFDMVLVRDLFIHLSFEEIFAALSNIRLSKSRYLVTSTYHFLQNKETPVAFHPINLREAPFDLPEPAFSFFENIADSPTRCIAVWELEQIPFFYSQITL